MTFLRVFSLGAVGIVLIFLLYTTEISYKSDRETVASFLLKALPIKANPPIYPPLPSPDDEEYISLCVGVRDPDPDIAEFFQHWYHHHGIRRFYLLDDHSNPPLAERTDLFDIPAAAVTFDIVPDELSGNQTAFFYEKCVKPHRDKHTWMGFIDADEYLQMRDARNNATLKGWLQEWGDRKDIGAVSVHWMSHNSAGLLSRPADTTRRAFTRCVDNTHDGENKHLKAFGKLDLIDGFFSVHHVSTKSGTKQVTEHEDKAESMHWPITHDIWALHHYGIKSKAQFDEKVERNSHLGWATKTTLFDDVNAAPSHECLDLTTYYP